MFHFPAVAIEEACTAQISSINPSDVSPCSLFLIETCFCECGILVGVKLSQKYLFYYYFKLLLWKS